MYRASKFLFALAVVLTTTACLVPLPEEKVLTPSRYSIVRREVDGLSFGGVQVGQSIEELKESLHDGWLLTPDSGYSENGYILRGPSRFAQLRTTEQDGKRIVSDVTFPGGGLCYSQKPILPFDDQISLQDAQLGGLTSLSSPDPIQKTYFDPKDDREVTFKIFRDKIQVVILGWKGETRDDLGFD